MPASLLSAGTDQAAERARRSVALAFAVNGLSLASWLSRTPAVRDALRLTPSQLGLLLLCMSAGAVLALPLSGAVVHRAGAAGTVLGAGLTCAAGLLAVAGGLAAGSVALTGSGLAVAGLGTGTWDVAMNVEGAAVEHRLGRHLMPRFHAAFSIGSVVGALAGAGAAAAGVPVSAQLAVSAVAIGGSVVVAVRAFLPPATAGDGRLHGSGAARAWREPRTLLIGVLVLSFAFTEGTANDWLALALTDGHATSDAVGALGFGAFVTAMTCARLAGTVALARWGRPRVLRATAALACAGLLLVVAGPALPWVVVGAVLWGAGAALGFPVGMSAAADDPALAPARVSVVSSVGYTAFLAGPPLIGVLAGHVGILRALLVVLVALVAALMTSASTRPLPD